MHMLLSNSFMGQESISPGHSWMSHLLRASWSHGKPFPLQALVFNHRTWGGAGGGVVETRGSQRPFEFSLGSRIQPEAWPLDSQEAPEMRIQESESLSLDLRCDTSTRRMLGMCACASGSLTCDTPTRLRSALILPGACQVQTPR